MESHVANDTSRLKRQADMSATTPRIFVSHSHKDDEFGVRLIRDLMRVLPEPDAVWYDSHGGLQGGVTWWTTIVHEITTRNIFIVILTPDAVNSSWVTDEINLAWQERHRGMLILPILRLACTIRADIRTLHVLDFQSSRDYDLAFNELLAAIGITAPQAVHQPPSPAQPNLLARFLPQIEASCRAQDWSSVIRKMDHLLKHSPDDIPPEAYLWYGDALQHRKQPDKAQGAYEMALVMVTDKQQHLAILHSYANLLLSEQRWDEALTIANEALGLAPNNSVWSRIKEKTLGHNKNKDEWLKKEWVEEGDNLYNLKRFEKALAAYDHALQLNPNNADVYINKGNALYSLKRFEEALVAYDHALQLDHNNALAYINKGIALHYLKRYEEARAAYNHAIQLNPNDAIAYYNKGIALQAMKRNKEAQACFDKARELGYSA